MICQFKITIPKLRKVAIVTQMIYGSKKFPAALFTLKKIFIVANMDDHNIRIIKNAPKGFSKPKNTIDHKAFNMS